MLIESAGSSTPSVVPVSLIDVQDGWGQAAARLLHGGSRSTRPPREAEPDLVAEARRVAGELRMSPNDQYLCIVPAWRSTPRGLRFVPFEGDGMLSLVLSKALLLADDHRITDPSIVRQIG